MRLIPWPDDNRSCPDGRTCPTKYRTDRGTAVIQGWHVTDPEAIADANPPEGEGLLEVPLWLVGLDDDERS